MKRSDLVTLTLVGAGIAASMALAPNYQRLERKQYTDRRDCECDYGPARCETTVRNSVVGPWYAVDPDVRRKDPNDPGTGRCNRTAFSGGYGGGSGSKGFISTEQGYRKGFGGTAYRGTPPRS